MKFNRTFFFNLYRVEFGKLSQSQVDGLEILLAFIEADPTMDSINKIAYVLATIKHETADTYLPIAEYGKGEGRAYGRPDGQTGQTYYGRGYIQLTWKTNYLRFSGKLGIDLTSFPDRAMNPDIAYKIMSIGMLEGSFTGTPLGRYVDAERADFKYARRVVNGLDRADLIASYAVRFVRILRAAKQEPDSPSSHLKIVPESNTAQEPPIEKPAGFRSWLKRLFH